MYVLWQFYLLSLKKYFQIFSFLMSDLGFALRPNTLLTRLRRLQDEIFPDHIFIYSCSQCAINQFLNVLFCSVIVHESRNFFRNFRKIILTWVSGRKDIFGSSIADEQYLFNKIALFFRQTLSTNKTDADSLFSGANLGMRWRRLLLATNPHPNLCLSV